MEPILQIQNLHVDYATATGSPLHALRGVTLDVRAGEMLGLLGESGCGKSTLARAIPALLPPSGRITNGSIHFRGQDLAALPEPALRRLRGAAIALISQDPASALHPLMRARLQVADIARCHGRLSTAQAHLAADAALEEAGLPVSQVGPAYPHQLSGGQRQRVAIARALISNPALLIADEPTSFLDSIVQAGLLRLLRRLTLERGLATILISHNPVVLAAADRIAVLYAGQTVECQPTAALFAAPLHPYTRRLLQCLPALEGIPGIAPDASALFTGCLFQPRCDCGMDICAARSPSLRNAAALSTVSCWHYGG